VAIRRLKTRDREGDHPSQPSVTPRGTGLTAACHLCGGPRGPSKARCDGLTGSCFRVSVPLMFHNLDLFYKSLLVLNQTVLNLLLICPAETCFYGPSLAYSVSPHAPSSAT
jgi:hypothetical protein